MLNWLNRQKSSATASVATYPQPPLANWRNREKPAINRNTIPEPDRVIRSNRKLKYLELFAIAAVISLIVGVDLYIFGINKRLSALEGEFVEVKTWAFPASLLEGKYTSLNARVRALTEAYNGLDAKLAAVASSPVTVAAGAAGDEAMPDTEADAVSAEAGNDAMAVSETEIPSDAPAAGITRLPARNASASAVASGMVSRADEETPAAASTPAESQPVVPGESAGNAPSALHSEEKSPEVEAFFGEPPAPSPAADTNPPQVNVKQGPWVINLMSDPNEALVERFAARARDRGVPVEQNRTEVNGRVFWRVQITGFETANKAQARAEEVKETLRLKDVWIFKQQG
jgi:hypothetical protein